MEDERMSLFDVSIQDNDVIAFGDVVYKVEKIRSIFKDLLQLTYPQLTIHLNQQTAYKFGLANADNSISDIYSENYYDFKYLKLGKSDWLTGKLRIYLSVFLYSKESYIRDQLTAGCYYPQLFFDDNDVISLKEDCFCKMKPIRAIFREIASNNSFASNIAQQLAKSILEFTGSNLFLSGQKCELLRLGSSSWESLILGIQFTIDAVEDISVNEQKNFSDNIISPLDEIRNTAV